MKYFRQFNNPMIKYVIKDEVYYYNVNDLLHGNFPVDGAINYAELYDVETGEMLYGEAIDRMSDEEAEQVYVYGIEVDMWSKKLKVYINMSVERSEELTGRA